MNADLFASLRHCCLTSRALATLQMVFHSTYIIAQMLTCRSSARRKSQLNANRASICARAYCNWLRSHSLLRSLIRCLCRRARRGAGQDVHQVDQQAPRARMHMHSYSSNISTVLVQYMRSRTPDRAAPGLLPRPTSPHPTRPSAVRSLIAHRARPLYTPPYLLPFACFLHSLLHSLLRVNLALSQIRLPRAELGMLLVLVFA